MKDVRPYRSAYESLADDADFQNLTPLAQAVFWTVKLKLGPYGIGVLYVSMLAEYHRRASEPEIRAALRELEAEKPSGSGGWLLHERNVFWIRNGFRFEPTFSTTNPNHRKSALRHARALPSTNIVRDFIAYYELEGAESVKSGRPPKHPNSAEEMGSPESINPLSSGEEMGSPESINPLSSGKEIPFIDRNKSPLNQGEGEGEGENYNSPSSSPSSARARVSESGPAELTRAPAPVPANEGAIGDVLPSDADRAALGAVVHVAPNANTWLWEMAAALNAMPGHTALTPAQLGRALRDYLGNGASSNPNLTHFRGYLRSAAKPPPESNGRARSSGAPRGARTPPQQFDYGTPAEDAEDVKWKR